MGIVKLLSFVGTQGQRNRNWVPKPEGWQGTVCKRVGRACRFRLSPQPGSVAKSRCQQRMRNAQLGHSSEAGVLPEIVFSNRKCGSVAAHRPYGGLRAGPEGALKAERCHRARRNQAVSPKSQRDSIFSTVKPLSETRFLAF